MKCAGPLPVQLYAWVPTAALPFWGPLAYGIDHEAQAAAVCIAQPASAKAGASGCQLKESAGRQGEAAVASWEACLRTHRRRCRNPADLRARPSNRPHSHCHTLPTDSVQVSVLPESWRIGLPAGTGR